MGSVINTNIGSLNAQRSLSMSGKGLAVAMERLSTGSRINSAKDDAAGLAIATRLTSQSRGLSVGSRNANDAIAVLQIADTALNSVNDNMQRMRELALQSMNDTNGTSDRNAMQLEYKKLSLEVARSLNSTNFNGKLLLVGGMSNANFQIGTDSTSNSRINVAISNLTQAAGLKSVINGTSIGGTATSAGRIAALKALDAAIDKVNDTRGSIGASQNRLLSVIAINDATNVNVGSARSNIMDTDFAQEAANMAKFQILQQAGTAMLTQANSAPQSVLSLLR